MNELDVLLTDDLGDVFRWLNRNDMTRLPETLVSAVLNRPGMIEYICDESNGGEDTAEAMWGILVAELPLYRKVLAGKWEVIRRQGSTIERDDLELDNFKPPYGKKVKVCEVGFRRVR